MKTCTETTRRWPDAYGDVDPDEVEDFLAHTEVCPYHAAVLRAAEEPIFSDARLARQLMGDGRLLAEEELKRSAAESRQLLELWRKAAAKRESPFISIALYNGDKEIARSSLFRQVNIHDLEIDLETESGIQIWGIVMGEGVKVEARLGRYELVEVCHKGETIHDLENGYTVGLKIKWLRGETYKIKFRCIETEMLKREKEQAAQQTQVRAKAAAAASSDAAAVKSKSSASKPPAKRASRSFDTLEKYSHTPPPRSWQLMGYCSTVLLMIMASSAVLLLFAPGVYSNLPSLAALSKVLEEKDKSEKNQIMANKGSDGPPPGRPANKKAQTRLTSKNSNRPPKAARDKPTDDLANIEDIAIKLKDYRRLSELNPSAPADPLILNTTATRLRRVTVQGASQGSRSRALRLLQDKRPGTHKRQIVLRVADDPIFLKRLEDRIAAYAGTKWGIKPHPAGHSDKEALKVDLDIRPQNTGIKLVVRIKASGEYERSFPGAGDNLADASANALEDAIPYVFRKIDNLLNPQSPTNAERVGGRSGGMATNLQAPGSQPLDTEVALDTRSVANRNPEED